MAMNVSLLLHVLCVFVHFCISTISSVLNAESMKFYKTCPVLPEVINTISSRGVGTY